MKKPISSIDKALRDLANPSWLEAIRKLDQTYSLTTQSVINSVVRESATKFSEQAKLTSRIFHETGTMASIRKFSKMNNLSLSVFEESVAMKSAKALLVSTSAANIAKQYLEVFQPSDSAAKMMQSLTSIAATNSEAVRKATQFTESASFKALLDFANSSSIPDFSADELEVEFDDIDFGDTTLANIDEEIGEELSKQIAFGSLSERTKQLLIYVYHFYFLPLILSCIATYVMTNAMRAQDKLESASTASQVRAFVRTAGGDLDRSALKGFRVTTAKTLNFRLQPRMKSEIITTIPLGTVVEVIDKSNRSWLLVEVEVDGEYEQGWVSRRYTTYFK